MMHCTSACVVRPACSACWMVQLRHAGRRVCLGYFHDELEAAKAYDAEVLRLKGPKSPVNFPDASLGRE